MGEKLHGYEINDPFPYTVSIFRMDTAKRWGVYSFGIGFTVRISILAKAMFGGLPNFKPIIRMGMRFSRNRTVYSTMQNTTSVASLLEVRGGWHASRRGK